MRVAGQASSVRVNANHEAVLSHAGDDGIILLAYAGIAPVL
jgi:hypothetical protein